MADIQQDYASMLEIANVAVGLQEQFDQLRQKLERVNNTLEACWVGNAQVEVAIAYGKLAPKLAKVSKTLSAYTKTIKEAVKAEQATEHASSTQFRSIDSVFGV